MSNHGKLSEELANEVCKYLFLHDFVVPNPMFTRPGGIIKEAADIFVPFRDKLLCFQIKSKLETKSANDKTESDFQRITRKIEEAVGQLRTTRNAVRNSWIDKLKTSIGVEVKFDQSNYRNLIGIVLIDLIGEEKFSEEERTQLFMGCGCDGELEIHVFRMNDFREMTNEITTIPDFLEYLDLRREFLSNGNLNPGSNELDFLAIYKSRYDWIDEIKFGKVAHISLAPGIWESYRQNCAEKIKKRNEEMQVSLLVDNIIENMRAAIGHSLENPEQNKEYDKYCQPAEVSHYWGIITEIANLRRLHRRFIGEKLVEKLRSSIKTGQGYFAYQPDGGKTGYVFLCSNLDRLKRIERLQTLCTLLYFRLDLEKVVGIATEDGSCDERSFDGLVAYDIHDDNPQELKEFSSKVFGPMNADTIDEWK